MYGFLHKPVVNTGRSTGWGGGWVEGLTALLMQRAIETVLQPLDLIQQMMSPLQTQESLFYQPGNTATTYPGHMTQCLHSPCMDVRSEAHKHTQTMEPLSGPVWLIGPPTWTNMNNLHNLSLQTTTWWNKQDSRAVRWPSRLDLVRWTLAPCSMWTSGTITITTDCASGGTTCGNVCTKNKQYLKKLLFEESFRYYRIMFLLFCFCFFTRDEYNTQSRLLLLQGHGQGCKGHWAPVGCNWRPAGPRMGQQTAELVTNSSSHAETRSGIDQDHLSV